MSLTDHDLDVSIHKLVADSAQMSDRTLEEYLRALLEMIRAHADADGISPEEFLAMLSRAFVAEPPAYDPAWEESYQRKLHELHGFARCETQLLQQIVDLREMREAGILDREWAMFGVAAPRGGTWHNLDTFVYLGGATAAIDRFEKGDIVRYECIPGVDTVKGADGVRLFDDLHFPVYSIGDITWDQLALFLAFGQIYE